MRVRGLGSWVQKKAYAAGFFGFPVPGLTLFLSALRGLTRERALQLLIEAGAERIRANQSEAGFRDLSLWRRPWKPAATTPRRHDFQS